MVEKIADGFKNEKAIILPYTIRTYLKNNNATKLLHVTHIGYYPEAKYHFRERKAGANQNILIFCEKGKGWIIYKGEKNYLEKNQVFILPSDEAHAYGAENYDPWSIYWIHFLGENSFLFSSIMGKKIDTWDSDSSRSGDRFLLFEEIYQNLEMGYSPENLEYASFCLTYLLASIKYLPQFREIKNVKEMDVIQKSILFMKNNMEGKIGLEDIAQSVGYSSSHFGNLFLKETSYTPIEYYNQLKIQRACSYLQFSDLKIKEIAYRLGYFDPFHFSKAFKKETSLTPKEYRRKYNP
jgi:Transcriptional regulator containing an amidase domain and an AraC-type DNA-binding HTH domain